MQLRLDRYQSVERSLGWRSMTLLTLGGLGVVFGSFATLLGLLMVVMEDGGLWEMRAGIVIGVFLGVFPLLASGLMIWRGVLGRARLGRLRDLAAFARHSPRFGPADLAQTLHMKRQDAEALVLDATSLGILEDGPPGREGLPSTPDPRWHQAAHTPPGLPVADALARTAAANLAPHRADGSHLSAAASGLPAASTIAAGALLNGTYRIEGHLGSGGMGTVHAARHLRTGRRYAVKTLLADARLSPDAIRRFEREATAASAIGHPGIIAVHDYNETPEGIHYLVMDLLEGETLQQRLSRVGSLAWPEARRVALEIASALAAAHDHGLLHRDLKPANILLAASAGAPERAVLLDFGLVKPQDEAMISRITVTGAAVGTPMYMSPEQARGDGLDVRSDLYGLAAVIYEAVTGAPPFLDRTLASVYARLLTEAAPAASSVAPGACPPGLDEVLARALAKRPEDRPPDVRAFAAALAQIPGEARADVTSAPRAS